MKKRLLALALCLVMMTSLLPVTAAAVTYYLTSVTLTADGVEEVSGAYKLKNIQYELIDEKMGNIGDSVWKSDRTGWVYTEYYSFTGGVNFILKTPPEEGKPYYVRIDFAQFGSEFNGNSSFSATLEIPGYTVERLGKPQFDGSQMALIFKITKNHEHTWQFKQAGNTLTGTCGSCGEEVSVTLTAQSVTLPNSPFNAWLEGWEQFKAAIPLNTDPVFDYKCDGVAVTDQSNPKAGKYQAGVAFTNLPGPIVDESGNPLNQAYLYTQYTAVDPAVTAQTGDNRPIELMLGSVVVFSALAAAAFVADSKRKNASL